MKGESDASSTGRRRGWLYQFDRAGIVLIHIGTVVALVRGLDRELVAMCAVSYLLRMFGITAGYHRYFAHRAYKTSRAFQFLLALVGTSATQKGPLWWAAAHRKHHKHSDTPLDVHSPIQRGFWYSHLGWWWGDGHVATEWAAIADFTKYPELVFLDRWHVIGVALNIFVAYAL